MVGSMSDGCIYWSISDGRICWSIADGRIYGSTSDARMFGLIYSRIDGSIWVEWIDMANRDVPHYGLKFVVDTSGFLMVASFR